MKYIVTIPGVERRFEIEADSRTQALCQIGATVWTAEEWAQAQKDIHEATKIKTNSMTMEEWLLIQKELNRHGGRWVFV